MNPFSTEHLSNLRREADELIASPDLREQASGHELAARESFDRCDTDGFLSQYASGLAAQRLRAQADINDAGGVAEFPALFDLDGNRVPAKLIDGRFGRCWAIVDIETGNFTGEFISAFPKRAATIERKGYREGTETARAKAVINGRGTGLSGTCWVEVIRLDGGFPGARKED